MYTKRIWFLVSAATIAGFVLLISWQSAAEWTEHNIPKGCQDNDCARTIQVSDGKYMACPSNTIRSSQDGDRLRILAASLRVCSQGGTGFVEAKDHKELPSFLETQNLSGCFTFECASGRPNSE